MLTDAERHSLLKDEYLLLQNQYEDFDKRSLTIKGWIGSGSIAALAISLDGGHQAKLLIPMFTAVLALVFWWHEANWKVFQYGFRDRIRIIEAYFRQEPDRIDTSPPVPFQIYNAWFRSFTKDEPILGWEREKKVRPRSLDARFWEAAWQPFVCGLYMTIVGLSAVAFVAILLKW